MRSKEPPGAAHVVEGALLEVGRQWEEGQGLFSTPTLDSHHSSVMADTLFVTGQQ